MKQLLALFIPCVAITACAQRPGESSLSSVPVADVRVGGSCEGCEAVFEYGDRLLSPVDTLEDFLQDGPKMRLSGIIYHRDGKTPAADVMLYAYHTDQSGIYPTRDGESGWARRHGYLRTWVKTDTDGRYAFYTLRPASYPNGRNPAHIHMTVKEPGKTAYWIEDCLFDDDPFLTAQAKAQLKHRGGNGILVPISIENGITEYVRDIVLGLNVDGYPVE